MKKQRNYSQLKRTREILWKKKQWNRLCQSARPQDQKGGNKNAKESIERNATHSNRELETIKSSQSILDNSIAMNKTELKAINTKLNNAGE